MLMFAEQRFLCSLWRRMTSVACGGPYQNRLLATTMKRRSHKNSYLAGTTACGGPAEKESITERLYTTGRTCIEGEMSLRKGAAESGVFFGLSLFLTTLLLTFPQVESVLPIIVIDKWSPCLYLNPWSFPSYFQSLCLSEKGQWESWVGLKQPTEFNLPQFPSRQDQYWKEILPVLIWT